MSRADVLQQMPAQDVRKMSVSPIYTPTLSMTILFTFPGKYSLSIRLFVECELCANYKRYAAKVQHLVYFNFDVTFAKGFAKTTHPKQQ